MILVVIIVIGIIVYLFRDNRTLAEEMRHEPDPIVKANYGCGIGVGWIVIAIIFIWLVLGAAVGFEQLDLGYDAQGKVTLTEPCDPTNVIAAHGVGPSGVLVRDCVGGQWGPWRPQ